MTVTPQAIARAGLDVLNEVGLDGLTMRQVADALGVRPPTLYWHVKNKQELLDAMAALLVVQVGENLEAPARGVGWEEWMTDLVLRARRLMLSHRDGARVLAGSYTSHPTLSRTIELALRTLHDAGFPLGEAARALPVLLHYTVGFTIEEQARTGAAYGAENPYADGAAPDVDRYPLTASAVAEMTDVDSDGAFLHGLRVILVGLRVTALGRP